MPSITARVARLTATSALILTVGATAAAGPAAATYNSWAGAAPIEASGEAAGPDTQDGATETGSQTVDRACGDPGDFVYHCNY
jgi:hypothetical protein